MIRLEDLFSLLEGNFDFLLVVDGSESVVHLSPLMMKLCPEQAEDEHLHLSDLLEEGSLKSFREAILRVSRGARGVVAVFTADGEKSIPIPMKVGYIDSVSGGITIFFGTQVDGLRSLDDWEREERVKELSCLYSVAEWIEVSSSIGEFFTHLPDYLPRGMRYPEEAVVWSVYQGVEYGQEPVGEDFLSVTLIVSGQPKGEIRTGYVSGAHELLPEEQRMLTEIGRMLSLALERKELTERMVLKHEEEEDYARRLRELEEEVVKRQAELDLQKQKLSTADSYLNRVNRSWDEAVRRLETIFKAIPDEVMLIDLNRNVVMSNQESMEPGDKCFRTCFHRETPCDDCRLDKIKRDKTPITMTIRDGERYLEVHTLPIFGNEEEVDGILEFYRDITLEKTYEQQLQQADKLASLGQLVSGIGHEINNPNQFIRGNIKILDQALTDMLPIIDEYYSCHPDLKIARLKYDFFRQHIMTLVDDMSHGSERIKGIVEGLRGFARKDEGLLVDRVDVNTLIQATTRLVQNEVHKHAEIELDLGKGVRVFTGNSQKIEQVLVNLIVNASQAIPDDRKGLITVRTRMDGEFVTIEIGDNGRGMDAKTMKSIFDPFFTTKRAKGGTGLGLAIAYRIVEEHGGSISVSSRPDEGTAFSIRIPTPAADESGR